MKDDKMVMNGMMGSMQQEQVVTDLRNNMETLMNASIRTADFKIEMRAGDLLKTQQK
jgi:hypothetical protein